MAEDSDPGQLSDIVEVSSPDPNINDLIDNLVALLNDESTFHGFLQASAGDLNNIVSDALAEDVGPEVSGAVGQLVEYGALGLANNFGNVLDVGWNGVENTLELWIDQELSTGQVSTPELVDSLGQGIGETAEAFIYQLNLPFVSDQAVDQIGSAVAGASAALINAIVELTGSESPQLALAAISGQMVETQVLAGGL